MGFPGFSLLWVFVEVQPSAIMSMTTSNEMKMGLRFKVNGFWSAVKVKKIMNPH